MSSADDRRQFYRIRFPRKARPKLYIGTRSFVVTELSEGGLRIQGGEKLQGQLRGRLIFSNGHTLDVSGTVDRHEDETIILQLQGVSFADMMDEQRRLVRIFPFMPNPNRHD